MIVVDDRIEWEVFRGDNLIIVSGHLVEDAFRITNKTITELKQKGKSITKVDFMDFSNSEHRANFKTINPATGHIKSDDTSGWPNPVHTFMVKIEYEKKSHRPTISFYGSIISISVASGVAIFTAYRELFGMP